MIVSIKCNPNDSIKVFIYFPFHFKKFRIPKLGDEDVHERNKRSDVNRFKRQIERQLISDGVPIEVKKGALGVNETSSEGLRIYDSWYQNSNSIPLSSRYGRRYIHIRANYFSI